MPEFMTEITEEQAIRLHNDRFWEELTMEERAHFQLFTERLCMPFGVFHEAVEKTLGRPVFTHEFAHADRLRAELLGERQTPSLQETIELIPEDKRTLIIASDLCGESSNNS